jgi:hypothetical protein
LGRVIFLYEDYHRETNGYLEKKCSLHSTFFPNEEGWFPCNEEYFYINNTNKSDGLHPECKKCASKKASLHFLNNREMHKEQYQRYLQTPNYKAYAIKNIREMKEYRKQYRKDNKDKVKKYNQKWLGHKEHDITKEELNELYEYCNHACMYCGMTEDVAREKFGKGLFKDHFVNDGSNGIENCILCCQSCSSKKWTKLFEDWYTPDNPIYSEERLAKIYSWINRFIQ